MCLNYNEILLKHQICTKQLRIFLIAREKSFKELTLSSTNAPVSTEVTKGRLKTQLNAQYLISWSGIFSFRCFHRALNQAVWMGRCEGFTARLNRLMCETVCLRYVQQFICVVLAPTLSAHITEGLDVWYDLGCVLHQSQTTNIQPIICKPPTAILFK